MTRFPPEGRVLVVDDQELARDVLCAMLEVEGFSPEPCASPLEALQRIAATRYDAVLLDVLMPELDGIEVCRRVRDSGDLTTPILLVTALSDRQSRLDGKQAGADDFLTKPVDSVELVSRVRCLQRVRAWYVQVESERDRFASELEKAHQAILRVERMATVGNMAAGLGHEIKNLAFVASGMREVLDGDELPIEEVRDNLAEISSRLDQLGRHLMRLGRDDHDAERVLDFGRRVDGALRLCRAGGRVSGVAIGIDIEPGFLPVKGRAAELDQVLLNLVCNAVDAAPHGSIAVSVRRCGPERARLEVSDNGPGLSDHVAAHLFEPYFTTKPDGRGNGLGLSVSKRIVEEMGGAVGLQNRQGGGATAWVELPLLTGVAPSEVPE